MELLGAAGEDAAFWEQFEQVAHEQVLKLRYGKEDAAAHREEKAAAEASRTYVHENAAVHIEGVVKMHDNKDEGSQKGKKKLIPTALLRFGRGRKLDIDRAASLEREAMDLRYALVDGQALHLYPLHDPSIHGHGGVAELSISGKAKQDSRGVVDAKKPLKRVSMVGAVVHVDVGARGVVVQLDEDASFTLSPMVLRGTEQATLDEWAKTLTCSSVSNFKADYKVVKRIGEGAFAKVFIATDRKTREKFAVKVLEVDRLDEKSRIYMRREISVLALLDEHPNIVTIRDVYEEPDRIFFVMELADCDLFHYLKIKGKMNEKTAKFVFEQVLRGIQHLHEAGITHRDIKPKNIVMSSLNSVKITDFGSARALENELVGASLALRKSTAGSGGFVAPEIIQNKTYGRKVDLWSAGVLLYYMLTHKLPFDATNEVLTYALIVRGKYSLDGSPWDEITPECKDLMANLMNLDVEARYRAEDALAHPWFSTGPRIIPSVSITDIKMNGEHDDNHEDTV
ncbi:Serine/threonine-protein kinase H1 [Porphyridium purpureum]|uniref:Serine/threonine-protein kinase H1 n=1 Tax=Porphyridium purpureum TaxID=35688 RepID=A0A5J4YVC7_PORPP|nr:Serine/threonine-protein kinase H1 [Porphyridium purpureum]|eukprot:POR4958..scf227_4